MVECRLEFNSLHDEGFVFGRLNVGSRYAECRRTFAHQTMMLLVSSAAASLALLSSYWHVLNVDVDAFV